MKKLLFFSGFLVLCLLTDAQTISITGQVKDQNGEFLEGVSVSIDDLISDETTTRGKFNLKLNQSYEGVEKVIRFHINGFEDYSLKWIIRKQNIDDTSNNIGDIILLRKVKPFIIAGYVHDSNNKPLGDVHVNILGTDSGFLSNSDGYFSANINIAEGDDSLSLIVIFFKKNYKQEFQQFKINTRLQYTELNATLKEKKTIPGIFEAGGAFSLENPSDLVANLIVQIWLGRHFNVGVGFSTIQTKYKVDYATLPGLSNTTVDTTIRKSPLGLLVRYTPIRLKFLTPSIGALVSVNSQQMFLQTEVPILPDLSLTLMLNFLNLTDKVKVYDFNFVRNSDPIEKRVNSQRLSLGISAQFKFQ